MWLLKTPAALPSRVSSLINFMIVSFLKRGCWVVTTPVNECVHLKSSGLVVNVWNVFFS